MNKKVAILSLILSSFAFSAEYVDLSGNSLGVEVEKGVSGFEIDSNYKNSSINSGLKGDEKILHNKYSLIENNKDNLFTKLEKLNNDKGDIYSIGYSGFKNDDITSNGADFIYINRYSDTTDLGISYNIAEIDFKKENGNLNEINLFSKFRENDEFFIISLYGGFLDDGKNSDNFYGLTGKYETLLDYYSEDSIKFSPFTIFNLSQYDSEEIKEKCDSIEIELGLKAEKNLTNNIDVSISTSYKKEFADKYIEGIGDSGEFEDSFKAKVEIPITVKNFSIAPTYEIEKSLNNSNYNYSIGVNFKIEI